MFGRSDLCTGTAVSAPKHTDYAIRTQTRSGADLEGGDAAQDEVVTVGGTVVDQLQTGQGGEAGQGELPLHPGQGSAEAEVDALAERDEAAGLAGQVEPVGVGERLGVAVGGTEHHGHDLAGG